MNFYASTFLGLLSVWSSPEVTGKRRSKACKTWSYVEITWKMCFSHSCFSFLSSFNYLWIGINEKAIPTVIDINNLKRYSLLSQ